MSEFPIQDSNEFTQLDNLEIQGTLQLDGQVSLGTFDNVGFPGEVLTSQGPDLPITWGSSSGGPSDVITVNNDSAGFPSSYQLLAGTNVTLTPVTGPPNTLTISATAGGGGVSTVTNIDGTLTISPTTGAVVASLNTSNANTWSAQQTFNSLAIYNNGTIQNVRVVTAAGGVNMTGADYCVVVNKTVAAATTVTLPTTPAKGQMHIIKDGRGDANTNNITIVPAAGNIDGASNFVMNTNYASKTVIYNGTQWNIL